MNNTVYTAVADERIRNTNFQSTKLRCCKIVRCRMWGTSTEFLPVIGSPQTAHPPGRFNKHFAYVRLVQTIRSITSQGIPAPHLQPSSSLQTSLEWFSHTQPIPKQI